MGKTTVEKRKKGRPSLLDLQKRSIELQKQQHKKKNQKDLNHNPNFRNPCAVSTPVRRSTRRNPIEDSDRNDEEEDEESTGKRREKKLKLVLRLPQRTSSENSTGGDSDEDPSGSEDSNEEKRRKTRKINAVSAGNRSRAMESGFASGSGKQKSGRHNSGMTGTENTPRTSFDSGSGTPLPNKKILALILDRLQKKDIYHVFSEPVDPNELPDYHEVIEHPMDFGTVRKKLLSGTYAYLEQFEKDVFLISSNAMRYNAPGTIYFRQGRSIQELAKKEFDILRQDNQENEPETKVVRRGRPPGTGKRVGRPTTDHAGSDFSDATLATMDENSVWSNFSHGFSRKAQDLDKISSPDVLARASSRIGENHSSMDGCKLDQNEELLGSALKSMSKMGKKPFVLDENRRSTYKQDQQMGSRAASTVFTIFDEDKKQIIAVGVHMEHAYLRSLTRFASNLGAIAWKVASKKMEKALPSGMKFGPEWVRENQVPQTQHRLPTIALPQKQPPGPPPSQSSAQSEIASHVHPKPQPFESKDPLSSNSSSKQPLPPSQNSSEPKTSPYAPEIKDENTLESLNDSPSSEPHPSGTVTSMPRTSIRLEPSADADMVRGFNHGSGFNLLSSGGGFRPRPVHPSQNPTIHPSIDGSSGYAFDIPSQPGKLVRPAGPVGKSAQEANLQSQSMNMVLSSGNSNVRLIPHNHPEPEESKPISGSNAMNPGAVGAEDQKTVTAGVQSQISRQGQPDSVPPDLNVRFQSPGSPASGISQQPDLALQL